MRNHNLLVISVLGLAACGSDDGGDSPIDGGGGGSPTDGGGGGAPIDAPEAVTCTVSTPSFGEKGALTGAAFFEADPENAALYRIVAEGVLEAAEPTDIIIVEFYTGYEPFGTEAAPTAVVPGTYQLTGAQLNYATCGVCVRLATNATMTSIEDDYMVTGGSVTVTTVGDAVGETLAVSFSNLQFEHVTIAEGGRTTPVNDGCTTSIASASYTGTVMAFPMR